MSATPKTGGDDLDDGLELDPSLLASDDEDAADLGEDEGAYLSDEEEEAAEVVSKKRKAEGSAEPTNDEQAKKDAKKRRREKDKARKAAKVGHRPS